MMRGPNDTAPMGLSTPDPERTEPGEPPVDADRAEKTDPGPPPGAASMTRVVKPSENGTDPGLDPMLEAFNRPPRPPAPQPNRKASSDGDEFAAHYAPPRELAAGKLGPTPHDPGVLVQLAQLAQGDTAPMDATLDGALARVDMAPLEPSPDATRAVQRDIETVVGRRKGIPLRTLGFAVAVGALVAAPLALFLFQGREVSPSAAPSAGLDTASAPPPLPKVPTADVPGPSSAVALAPPPSAAQSTSAAVVTSNSSASPPTRPPGTKHPVSSPSPRPATSDPVKAPPVRPAHEIPNQVF